MVPLREDNKSLWAFVVIFWIQLFIKHSYGQWVRKGTLH